jgi:colanic acid biosynthesis glycosyl transferase WcaI
MCSQDVFPETAAALGIAGTQGRPGRMLALLRDSSLRAAAVNVAIGEKMRDFLVACGADADTVRTIHNWCDDEVISPFASEDNALRRKWGLAGKFVVGYSGNLGRAHEFETILDAARRLEKHVEVVFLFIGGGHQWESVKNTVARRRIANVLFEPYQPRAALALSLTVPDVHLVSLRPELEGLIVPSKFYGIAAAGRPTVFIGAESGEIANLLARGKCGAVVGPGNGEGLAKVLLEWMMNPELRIRMGNNARLLLDGESRKASALVRWEALLKKL